MKVLCYISGQAFAREEYEAEPDIAATMFAEEWDQQNTLNVVVVPLDEEAGALRGWTLRPDGVRSSLHVVTRNGWTAKQVRSFEPEERVSS